MAEVPGGGEPVKWPTTVGATVSIAPGTQVIYVTQSGDQSLALIEDVPPGATIVHSSVVDTGGPIDGVAVIDPGTGGGGPFPNNPVTNPPADPAVPGESGPAVTPPAPVTVTPGTPAADVEDETAEKPI